jgi:hypothetical protein
VIDPSTDDGWLLFRTLVAVTVTVTIDRSAAASPSRMEAIWLSAGVFAAGAATRGGPAAATGKCSSRGEAWAGIDGVVGVLLLQMRNLARSCHETVMTIADS